MAETKSAKKATRKPAKAAADNASARFSDEERAAMKEHAEELKKAKRRGPGATREEGERDVLEKIAEMPEPDRSMAKRLHALITAAAPDLVPRTWYGMPAYSKDGSVLCFFQGAYKFKARYATLGFSDKAVLDDGPMWATGFALQELTKKAEDQIVALVKGAVG